MANLRKHEDVFIGRIVGDYKVVSALADAKKPRSYECVCTTCGSKRTYVARSLYAPRLCKCCRAARGVACNIIGNTCSIYIKYKDSIFEVLADLEDLEMLCHYKWHIDNRKGTPYAFTYERGKTVPMTHIISRSHGMAPEDRSYTVKHLNGNTLDNQKSNLAIVPRQGTSWHKGVYFRKDCRTKPWSVSIHLNGKYKAIGYFATFEEAVQAHEQAEQKYLQHK